MLNIIARRRKILALKMEWINIGIDEDKRESIESSKKLEIKNTEIKAYGAWINDPESKKSVLINI